jgi:hypothetical protein
MSASFLYPIICYIAYYESPSTDRHVRMSAIAAESTISSIDKRKHLR